MSRGRRSGRPRGEREAASPSETSPAKRSGGGKALSDDEMALWRRVVESVTRRLPEEAPTPLAPLAAPPRPDAESPAEAPRAPRRLRLEGTERPAVSPPPPSRPEVGVLSPSTPGLDRRTSERLRRGKIVPEARLDLHGMTSARAHQALIGFISRSAGGGMRCVLVITGKGGRPRAPEPGEWRESEPGMGVLKSLTPQWLAQPPLSALVVGVYPAHVSHGGGGAFYVYLRKRALRD